MSSGELTEGERDSAANSVPEDVLLARAYLCRVAEPANVALWALVRDVGAVEAAARVRAQEGVSERVRTATATRHDAIDPGADLEAAERLGIRLLTPESSDWPHFAMAALEFAGAQRAATYEQRPARFADRGEPVPPLALWAAGPADPSTLGVRAAAIVGARTSSSYGERVARRIARGLAERDVVVISGGAYGIDRNAHDGALDANGLTVLISAGGLDRAYPQPHAALYRRVRESGLLLSESPPGSSPQRHRFLSRNRLIACLATGSVIVEAATRSGALNTARHCVHLGRPLMAVPGPVDSPMSAGCHHALRREDWTTTLVTSASDVVEVIGTGEDLTADAVTADVAATAAADRRSRLLDGLDPRARAVFDGLPAGRTVDVDELMLACGLSAREVLLSLPALELAGLVDVDRAGYRARPLDDIAPR